MEKRLSARFLHTAMMKSTARKKVIHTVTKSFGQLPLDFHPSAKWSIWSSNIDCVSSVLNLCYISLNSVCVFLEALDIECSLCKIF